jgi:hypothetical protein
MLPEELPVLQQSSRRAPSTSTERPGPAAVEVSSKKRRRHNSTPPESTEPTSTSTVQISSSLLERIRSSLAEVEAQQRRIIEKTGLEPAKKKLKMEENPEVICLDSSDDTVIKTEPGTSTSTSTPTVSVPPIRSAASAEYKVGGAQQSRVGAPPEEFQKAKRPFSRPATLILAVQAFLVNMMSRPMEGDNESIDVTLTKAPRASIPKPSPGSEKTPRRCWVNLPRPC